MCQHCKSTLASKAGLAKHLRRGQCRLYQCSDCTKAFRYLHELRAHMHQEHMTDEIITASFPAQHKCKVQSSLYSTPVYSPTYLPGPYTYLAPPPLHKCKVPTFVP